MIAGITNFHNWLLCNFISDLYNGVGLKVVGRGLSENRRFSSCLQKSIFELFMRVPRNLLNSFKRSVGIVQYGSPGSPATNAEMQKKSPLSVAIPSLTLTSTSAPSNNFFAAGYHSKEMGPPLAGHFAPLGLGLLHDPIPESNRE